MSGDVAALGLSVDSSQVVRGVGALDQLSGAAARAEQAANGAATGADKLAGQSAQVAAAAGGAATALIRQAQASARAAADMQKAAQAGNQLIVVQRGVASQSGIIAAQFQDIGVQLAGGQSPFLIALQQGTQLSYILGTLGRGTSLVSALGGAFAALVSPLSLGTIALIALGGYLVEYFTNAKDNVEKTNAAFQHHADFIKSVADRWGEAVPALKSYNDELQRTADLQNLQQAGTESRADAITKANAEFTKLLADFPGVINQLQVASGNPDSMFHALGVAMEDLQDKVNAGTATIKDFNNARQLAATAAAQSGDQEITEFSKSFGTLYDALNKAFTELSKIESQIKTQLNPTIDDTIAKIQQLTTMQIKASGPQGWTDTLGPRHAAEFMPSPGVDIPIPTRRPSDFDKEAMELGALKKAAGSATAEVDKMTEAYNRLVQAQNDTGDRLRLEANLIGASAQERANAIAKLEMEQKIRQSNVQLTDKQTQGLVREAQAQAQLKLKVDQMTEGWKTVQDAGMSAIDQLTASIGNLDTSAKDLIQNLANTLLEPLKELAIANPLKNAIYGTNLPTMQSIGGFSGFFAALSGQKAPPLAGMPNATTGTMTVTAATVMINGAVGGFPTAPGSGLAGLLGYNPQANNTPTVNGVRPDLTSGGIVNSPVNITPGVARPTATNNAVALATNVGQNIPAGITPERMAMYQQAISKIESGSFAGNYSALGPTLKNGDYAIGRYQIMASNVPQWSQKYLGQQVTPAELRNNPAYQDAIFNGEFGGYVNKYGEAGASSKWFTGSPYPTGKQDVLGTSDNSYVKQFQQNLNQLSATSQNTANNMGTLSGNTENLSGGFSNLFSSLKAAPTAAAPAATGGVTGGGFFSWLGGLFGFAEGGYTGPGGRHEPAGIVHRGEYVINSHATRQFMPLLHLMNGYANGGPVSDPKASFNNMSANNMSQSQKVEVSVKVHSTSSVDKNGNIKNFVETTSQQVVDKRVPAHLKTYDEEHLPRRIKKITQDEYASG